jgi:pimeloyl-ACP methyl ester carboxylesterase
VYLHYNSGRHVSENGREFAEILERLVCQWPVPVEELSIVAHSMGGLVTRSAHHYGRQAEHQWPRRLRKIVFLGTPHHGAPLERGGNWLQALVGISPYTSPLSRLGRVRSAGVTDLRHGGLLDEDWRNADRFERHRDARQHVPLPGGVACCAIAATTGRRRGDLKDRLIGDGVVPVASALGRHRDPDRTLNFSGEAQWIGYGMSHWDLLDRPEVYEKIRTWIVGS